MNTITSYKGKGTYIFISYAHKDSEKVFRVIGQLCNARCRVWYDEGIEHGTDWSNEIAGQLSNSDCVIAFVSRNYTESEHCIKELNYAVCSLHKECLLVYLEDAELPSDVEMYMDATQAIRRESYKDEGSLWTKILKAPVVLRNQDKEFAQATHCCAQARMLEKTNRKKEAAKLYQEALEISRSLLIEDPEDNQLDSLERSICDRLDALLQETAPKKVDEFRQKRILYQARIAIKSLRSLAERNPEEETCQYSLAEAYIDLADLEDDFLILGFSPIAELHQEGETALRKAREILSSLIAKHPENEEYWDKLFFLYSVQLADDYLIEENPKEAEGLYREVTGMLPSSAMKHLGEDKYWNKLCVCYRNMALRHSIRGNSKEAEKLFRKAMEINRCQIKEHPGEYVYEEELAGTYTDFGYFLKEIGRKKEAVEMYQKAVEIVDRGLGIEQDAVGYWLEDLYDDLSALLKELNQTKEAEELRQKVWVELLGHK